MSLLTHIKTVLWRYLHISSAGLLLLLACIVSFNTGFAQPVAKIEITADTKSESVSIFSAKAITHKKLFTLTNPERIVFDFPSFDTMHVTLPAHYKPGLLRAIRAGQFSPDTSRVVFDLAVPARFVSAQSIRNADGSWRYEIKLAAINSSNQKTSEHHLNDNQLANKQKNTLQTPDISRDAPISTSNSARVAYEASQDEKPLIVIDAGHGGQDPGATGVSGIKEKTITLEIANLLRQAFLRTGRYRVALTRDSDRYIMLTDRVAIARKLKADMFISLHADSNPHADAEGFSVYTISETASDAEAEALAKRENSVDDLSGLDLGSVDKDVADILIDLAARETKSKSAQIADIIVEALHPKIKKLPSTHRFAGFRVLKSPDIPSVLIELGFLTNKRDEAALKSREYRDLVTQSIVRGVDAYYVTVKRR